MAATENTLPSQLPTSATGPTYEARLASDRRWALSEASLYFEGRGAVQESLRRITDRLNELGIPYAIAGAMALFEHGYRRFTEDVDILVTKDGLKAIHAALDGRGYVRPFAKSKNLRDTQTRVKIEFMIAGGYPGDGKPKPIRFPEPGEVSVDIDGIKVLNLPALITLKLASGISGVDRAKDIGDVQELIKVLGPPRELATSLHEAVREKYIELWDAVHRRPRRYVTTWRNRFLTVNATSLDEMIDLLKDAASTLEAMRRDGVTLDPAAGTADDYATLVTTDPQVAQKYGMEDESELWGDEDEADEPSVGPAS